MTTKPQILLIVFSVIMFTEVQSQRRCITWNMQGATRCGDSKWRSAVALMFRNSHNYEVVALQETGAIPRRARLTDADADTTFIHNDIDANARLEEYTWRLGTRSRPNVVYIYYYRTARVGLSIAILSRVRADEMLSSPRIRPGSRPAIGIRIGNDYFFTLHAASMRTRNEASLQVNRIEQFMAGRLNNNPAANWLIMGDFNRSPTEFRSDIRDNQPPPGVERSYLTPGQPTQVNGRELDYAISGRNVNHPAVVEPRLAAVSIPLMFISDHLPVYIVPT